MQILTDSEASRWCASNPLNLQIDDDGNPTIPRPSARFVVDISTLRRCDILPLARALTLLGSHNVELFQGALVWLRNLDIGVSELDRIAWKTLEKFRQGHGDNRGWEVARAHVCREDESSDLAALLALALIAEWDAHLIPSGGGWIAVADHDGRITVTAKSTEVATDLKDSLKEFGPISS